MNGRCRTCDNAKLDGGPIYFIELFVGHVVHEHCRYTVDRSTLVLVDTLECQLCIEDFMRQNKC